MLSTRRLLLRRLRRTDLAALQQLEADPLVVRHTGLRRVQSAAETEARLARTIAVGPAREPLGVWGAFHRTDGRLAAWVMLLTTEFPGPELGYMVPRPMWGQGYATEAAAAVVAHARTLRLGPLFAATDPQHTVSQAVLRKLGFSQLRCEPTRTVFRTEPAHPPAPSPPDADTLTLEARLLSWRPRRPGEPRG